MASRKSPSLKTSVKSTVARAVKAPVRALQRATRKAPASGRTWLARLWSHMHDWKAERAQRVIDRHAALIAELHVDVVPARAARDVTWSALHHGATCEAGFRADPPPRDFSAF